MNRTENAGGDAAGQKGSASRTPVVRVMAEGIVQR